MLVAGGFGTTCNCVLSSAEVYSPATATWSATNAMLQPREAAVGALLGNGSVVVAGGITEFTTSGFTASPTAEVFTLR